MKANDIIKYDMIIIIIIMLNNNFPGVDMAIQYLNRHFKHKCQQYMEKRKEIKGKREK